MQPVDKSKVAPQAYAILLGAQLAVGAAAIFARYALHSAGPVVVSALRLSIAALPLLMWSWSASRKAAIPRNHELLFAAAGIVLAVHFATWIGSLLYTSVAVSTLLVCTVPVWTALYDWLVLKQKLSKTFWLAMLAATVGVALMVGSKTNPAPLPGMEAVGDLLATIGGIAFAAYLIAIRSISNLYPTTVVVGRTYSWAALTLGVVALAIQQAPPPASDAISWGGIIGMALISQLLGHTGMNASLRWFSSSTVAFSTLLEPVFAGVLAAMIFAEHLSLQTVCGAVIVLISLALILRLQVAEVPSQLASEGMEL